MKKKGELGPLETLKWLVYFWFATGIAVGMTLGYLIASFGAYLR